jgi:hypothetical protein
MNAWTLADDRQVVEMRTAGIPSKVIARRLGRSAVSISGRLSLLGVTRTQDWTLVEDGVIWANYRKAPVRAWIVQLPGRSEGSVHARAHRLGMARPHRAW